MNGPPRRRLRGGAPCRLRMTERFYKVGTPQGLAELERFLSSA